MYISIYLHICMYVCMHVRIHVCMHVCIYVCMHICIHVCTCVCMYVFMYHQLSSSDCFDSLSHRRNVASSPIFYRYFHAGCSSKLANCMRPLLPRLRCTRLSTSFHPSSVYLSNARFNQYLHSFISYTCKLRNSLPSSIFCTCL